MSAPLPFEVEPHGTGVWVTFEGQEAVYLPKRHAVALCSRVALALGGRATEEVREGGELVGDALSLFDRARTVLRRR